MDVCIINIDHQFTNRKYSYLLIHMHDCPKIICTYMCSIVYTYMYAMYIRMYYMHVHMYNVYICTIFMYYVYVCINICMRVHM